MDNLELLINKEYPLKEVIEEEKFIDRELPFLVPNREEKWMARLFDIGEGRINQMDRAGIDMQILSLVSPGLQAFDAKTGTRLSRTINDRLYSAISKFPDRLAGFACLAPQEPESAAMEVERAVKELGFKGAVINSHTKGEYLDEDKFHIILETAENLDVPIYIHPRAPALSMINPFLDYPILATGLGGYPSEVYLHALRLICSGVLDKYPRLKIILGHLGEALPFWLWRLDNMWQRVGYPDKRMKTPSAYLKDNFFITTSGMFSAPPLLCSLLALGADRILFAVDHPFESDIDAVHFLKNAPISDLDKEKIFFKNAEYIFDL